MNSEIPKYMGEAEEVAAAKWDAYKMSPTERLAAKWRGLIHGPKPPKWLFTASAVPVLVLSAFFLNSTFSEHFDKNLFQNNNRPATNRLVPSGNNYESSIVPSSSTTNIR